MLLNNFNNIKVGTWNISNKTKLMEFIHVTKKIPIFSHFVDQNLIIWQQQY